MVYTPTTWVNKPSTATPINATRLNNMESGIVNAYDRAQHTGTQLSSTISDLAETIRDTVGATLVAGTGVTITVNDAGDTITIDASGGAGSTDPEIVRDTIASALVAGANVSITVNDAADTITIAATDTNTTDVEVVRDTIGSALVAGTNVSITVNDAADTITIAATDTNTTDVEVVRDTIATALVAGTGISITVDDPGNTITINSTGGGGGGGGGPATYVFSQAGVLAAGVGTYRIYNDTGGDITLMAIRATVSSPPSSTGIVVDVNMDGASVFSGSGAQPTIPSGGNTNKKTVFTTTTWPDGSYLTVDIDSVGSPTPGSNLTVQVTGVSA